jgi:ABC-type phosphate/phosphonate transport system substrate-binding protein
VQLDASRRSSFVRTEVSAHDALKVRDVLNEAMKALTVRKPIMLTTTSMCSGPFAARVAREQRLHALRVAGWSSDAWTRLLGDVESGLLKTYGLDVQTTTLPDAASAIAAVADGSADVAFTDTLTALRTFAHNAALQFVAVSPGMDDGYVALAPVIAARSYPMTRFARALRKHAAAAYVDARDLQALVDRLVAERAIDAPFAAEAHVSRVAVMSGTR